MVHADRTHADAGGACGAPAVPVYQCLLPRRARLLCRLPAHRGGDRQVDVYECGGAVAAARGARRATQTQEVVEMDVVERIKAELSSSPVVLFMKGTPDFPQCGFSAQTVAAL